MSRVRTSSETQTSLRRRRGVRTWQLLLLWLVCMLPLASWGLPTSRTDALLFGGQPPWSPERYQAARALEERHERIGGADTDLDPLKATSRIVDLTPDDTARAAILIRYRLYSRQPDEMITFMALQRMRPGELDFDPQLYQYGGGYIYLVGAALGLAKLLGVLELSGDVDVYLAKPELFARFYLVARAVTLVFGALTLVAAVRLARRAAGRTAGWVAFVVVAACPVFIAAVLEAKPHLPSACLLLWATLSALDYQVSGRRRDSLRMGLQAGLSFGLVLTGLAGVLLWPALLVARGRSITRRLLLDLALAAGLAFAVYIITNPYIVYNALFNHAALAGNLANSTAMYELGRIPAGLLRVSQLLLECCGPGVLLGGLLALAWLHARWPRRADVVSLPGIATLLLCVAIGADKPAEFARFLLLPTILLAVGAAVLVTLLAGHRLVWGVLATVVALAVMRTPAYVRSYAIDARLEHESRHRAARYLEDVAPPTDAVGVVQEPAPYAVPPIDFAHRDVRLLPASSPRRSEFRKLPEWLVLTADDATVYADAWWRAHYRPLESFAAHPLELSRISWANKPVYVYRANR